MSSLCARLTAAFLLCPSSGGATIPPFQQEARSHSVDEGLSSGLLGTTAACRKFDGRKSVTMAKKKEERKVAEERKDGGKERTRPKENEACV